MKNVMKKIAAAAIAFTLLGAGSVITEKVAPQTNNTLTASAACQYHGYRSNSDFVYYTYSWSVFPGMNMYDTQPTGEVRRCRCCGGYFSVKY